MQLVTMNYTEVVWASSQVPGVLIKRQPCEDRDSQGKAYDDEGSDCCLWPKAKKFKIVRKLPESVRSQRVFHCRFQQKYVSADTLVLDLEPPDV